MVACGRSIKKIHPEAKTVFIGPCLAKKAEAREPDIADAVDYVLTFEEVAELFDLMDIHPEKFEEDQSDHSSRAGRIYARASGVSEAVQATLDRLRPDRKIPLKARQADGVIDCKTLLKDIADGNIHANFIEGMGCRGGCVGGPKSLIDKDVAREAVNHYGDETDVKTPADNPYVLELLHMLGYETVESLLDRDNNFTRIL
ncbi:MAG TPA: [Fe-Fe] hydrogenase large subunit C-terminal domain-containing protein [Caproiciproducens sp.]|nr:[Fe-Fe] hydrogenase large subunit C-terminal domain-containing protein [Caproiciproducens sp.]